MAELPESLDTAATARPERAGILLVDGTPANLLSLRAILESPDYDLVEARSGEEALERLKDQEFAVVLLDVRMPGLSGFDTAKHIRADERSRHTPIIFLTADDIDREQAEAGYALGAVDFFVKPLSPVVVRAKVRGFARLYQEKQRARHEADQLRLLVQGTLDYAIFMLDPHGRVVTWNTGAERIKQYKADEIIGQHFSKFYPQEALDRGWPGHELEVATAEGRFEDEGWRLRKDGSRLWANVVITALRNEKGQLHGFSKVTRDLTERKRAEESLRRSEERFRHMVEGVRDYAIFMLDPHGNVATWNAGAERFKGYKADEIIGQHFSKFYPQDVVDRGWPAHELKVAEAEGQFEDEGWRVRKDGSQFWANVVITALKDDRGGLLGFSKITRDLTARKQAEENARRLAEETAARQAAHQERERLQVTLESIGDAVISTDAQGRVTFLNPVAEELIGWRSVEAAGRTLEDVFRIVNEGTRQPVENPALRALRDGKIVGLANHTVLISKDGTERPIDDSAAPIRDAAGDISGSVLVFRDISERKRNEAALAERIRLLALNAAVGEALVQGNGFGSMLRRCAEALVEHLDGTFARIWTLNEAENVLELRASAGMYTHLDGPHSRVPVGQFKIGLIAKERTPHLTNEVVGDPRVSDQEWAQREGMVAFAGYPLVVDDRLVGVMAMFARQPLSETTLDAMASVADEIAVGIERKIGEERLHQQREWLSVTLASIGDAVLATDAHGRVTFLNGVAQEMTGWTLADADGQPLETIFPIINEQTRQPVKNPVEKVLREGVIVGLANHTVLVARDGTERPIDDSAAPIRDSAGKLVGVVLIFRDVTEQRRADRELRSNEARNSAILQTALDCIITMDHQGRVVEFNPAAEKTFGYRREQVVGKQLADFIIPHSLRERHRHGMAHYLATGEGPVLGERLELPALRADGTEFPVEIAITRIPTDGPPLFTAYLRDVTEAKRAEQHRNARLGVTHALNEAVSLDDGAERVLRAVCENLGWDVGFFWTVSGDDESLVCRRSWHRPDVPVGEFETASRSRTFGLGEGLPGRAWASGKPAWVLDISQDGNFPRLASAVHYDLHSAIACPVVVGDRTLGVIEFFTKRLREADAALLETMGSVAGNVGQFAERKAAEDSLRQSERELSDFFENATVGLHWVGPDGIILRANRAELDMLGYSREEYVGRPIADFHADEDTIIDILKRLQAGEKLNDFPARLRCRDGAIKDVLIDSSVMFRDGGFVHTRCFTRDVTERKRAEGRVREQEQRTRTILESVTDAFFGLGRDWRFTYVNRQAEVLLGRTRDDLLGTNIWEEFAPAVGTDFDRSYRRAVAENVTVTFEAFYPPHDRWYEVNAYPSPDGLSVYFRDVGERKRAEAAIRESEAKLRLLADTIPQLAWTARPDGHIFWYNRRWYEYTGTTPGQMEGWGWQSVHDPDTLPAVLERWKGSIATGEPFDMVFPLKGADGRFRPFLTRVNPLRDEQGRILYWFGTNTDVSEQQRAAEASRFLSAASATLAAVVDYESTLGKVAGLAVPHFADWCAVDMAGEDGALERLAVAHADPDRVRLAEELHRRYPPRPDDPFGPPHVLRTGQPEMAADLTDEMLVALAQDADHLRLLRELRLRSYISVPVLVRGRPLGVVTFVSSESGRAYGPGEMALAQDLAHRAAVAIDNSLLYQQLRDADRRKDEFLATLAHELRNPLAPIRNALQILKMPRVDAATVGRSRDMMERQVHHLVRLVDDLLDVSRVMRGKIELRKERVELATVVARAVETVQPLVDAQGHELSVGIPTESLLLDADPVRLAQVVGNLLTNAAKYTEPGGRIRLTATRDGHEAVLRIRDTGIGIAPDVLPRIFDLFVQVDHAATRSQGGLGIGLTLVKNLCEMHNGSVEARSAGLGQGSEFVVRLPLSARSVEKDAGPDTPLTADAPRPTGHRLLVVDDNQDAADSLAMLLKLQGHEVRVAHSGPAALEITKHYAPDVVFLDIGMPGMDGYEVARRMRQQPGLENVVLAALTGWGQQEDRRRTAEAGFDHHLVKPPEPKAVENVLTELKRNG